MQNVDLIAYFSSDEQRTTTKHFPFSDIHEEWTIDWLGRIVNYNDNWLIVNAILIHRYLNRRFQIGKSSFVWMYAKWDTQGNHSDTNQHWSSSSVSQMGYVCTPRCTFNDCRGHFECVPFVLVLILAMNNCKIFAS